LLCYSEYVSTDLQSKFPISLQGVFKMASNTKNVKLGVCRVFFKQNDLGYTQGGVEVTVKTDTHKLNVDQFGKTAINEYVMGREIAVKVPLAETTLENLVATMPGASLVTDGVQAAGTITVVTQPTTGQTIVIGGKTIVFKTLAAGPLEVTIGASTALTAANLAAMLDQSSDPALVLAFFTVGTANLVSVVYDVRGVVGNSFTLASGTAAAAVTVSGATLLGGVDATSARVDVTTGVGIDLLSIAGELRLHPIAKPDGDKSEDFVIPLAATPGALKFAYKVDAERVYDIDFSGFPDSLTNRLFYIGA
jgi:hypothetical protein